MDKALPIISYTLVTLSGICFIGGLVILSNEGRTFKWTESRISYPC